MTGYPYIPMAALGVRLLTPVEQAKPFFAEHRDVLVDDFGSRLVGDLEMALENDLGAARRFAEGLAPGATLVLKPRDEQGFATVDYSAFDGNINGSISSPHEDPARLLVAAAINVWYQINRAKVA